MLDLFLILTFYLNYYYVAGAMMRRRLFGGYVAFVLVIAAIALFMPIICKALFGWQTPTEDLPSVSISWLGAIGAITGILSFSKALKWLFAKFRNLIILDLKINSNIITTDKISLMSSHIRILHFIITKWIF